MTAPDSAHRTRSPRPRAVAIEICVDDVAGALAAEAQGADRIELCSALSEGGLTPSLGLVETVCARIARIGLQVMIRPRGGDFHVDRMDLEVMLADIAALSRLRRAVPLGFVFGALTRDGMIDVATTRRLKAACGDAPTTFHKAFDRVADQSAALEALADLGIGRVLTSGGAPTATAGTESLAALVGQARGRITLLAGGGVRAGNARQLVAATNVPEIHLRAMREMPGRTPVTDPDAIAAVRHAVEAA